MGSKDPMVCGVCGSKQSAYGGITGAEMRY